MWLFGALWTCLVVAGVRSNEDGVQFLIGTGSHDMYVVVDSVLFSEGNPVGWKFV